MNIEQAKLVPLATILSSMGADVAREQQNDIWYKSPFRQEKTASFHVKPSENVWFDHGIGKGGDGINLVCTYLKFTHESDTVADALRWIKNMTSNTKPFKFEKPHSKREAAWKLKQVSQIKRLGLIHYLLKRKIPVEIANLHLREITVENNETGSTVFALGMLNEDEGYELRNPFLKSCVAPKAISFVRGEVVKPTTLHIFEGVFDFLSAATQFPDMIKPHDAIILNSVSLLERAYAYIKGYGYNTLYTWFDNDEAGARANSTLKAALKNEEQLICRPMNHLYHTFKDVNEWHTAPK